MTKIPKKIHYCWLSDDPMPAQLQACMASWKKYLPDYELVKWDLQRFPLDKNRWVREAYENRKYAFAADYIRLYALATEGGIYLDSDVEVLRPFDDLLHLPYFICRENSPKGIEAATMGAAAGTAWVEKCLAYYDGKSFVDDTGKQQVTVLPVILEETIRSNFTLRDIATPADFIADEKTVCLLPQPYFSPKNYVTKRIRIAPQTYSIHHFAGSWQPAWKKMLLHLWVPFSVKFPQLAGWLKKIVR